MKIRSVILGALLCVWSIGCSDTQNTSKSAGVDIASLQKTLQANELDGSIVSSQELGSGLSMIVAEISNQQVPFLATNDGKMILQPDLMIFQDKSNEGRINTFYEEMHKQAKAKTDEKVISLFKDQSANAFKFKAKKASEKTIYIISDANCPYCQKELENLDNRLEEANVELIVVGFLGEDSMLKAANALKSKSDDEAKNLALLKKLYTPKSKVEALDTKAAMELTQAVAELGVRSVPYIIE